MHRALLPFGRGRVCSRIIKSRGLRSNLSPQSAEKASFIYSGTGSGAAQGAQAVCTLLQVLCHNLLGMLKCLVLLGREHFQLCLEAGKRWSRQGCGGSWHGLTSDKPCHGPFSAACLQGAAGTWGHKCPDPAENRQCTSHWNDLDTH